MLILHLIYKCRSSFQQWLTYAENDHKNLVPLPEPWGYKSEPMQHKTLVYDSKVEVIVLSHLDGVSTNQVGVQNRGIVYDEVNTLRMSLQFKKFFINYHFSIKDEDNLHLVSYH